MSVTVESSGTQTATISTEHSLATPTGAKVYQLIVDLNNLANGDVLELRVKQKVLSAGTVREFLVGTYANVQTQKIAASIPVTAPQGAEFTLKQTAGTGRAFDWAVVSL